MSAKKTAFYGMFLALALVAGYIEQLIPINLGIPGVKLGLANIVTMLLLYIVGVPAACLISVLRILLSGFLFGSGFAMVYSAAGAAMSMLVMALLKKTKKFSSVGVSVAGGSVDVARYAALIQAKSPANCNAHLAESIFQTRSKGMLD